MPFSSIFPFSDDAIWKNVCTSGQLCIGLLYFLFVLLQFLDELSYLLRQSLLCGFNLTV